MQHGLDQCSQTKGVRMQGSPAAHARGGRCCWSVQQRLHWLAASLWPLACMPRRGCAPHGHWPARHPPPQHQQAGMHCHLPDQCCTPQHLLSLHCTSWWQPGWLPLPALPHPLPLLLHQPSCLPQAPVHWPPQNRAWGRRSPPRLIWLPAAGAGAARAPRSRP